MRCSKTISCLNAYMDGELSGKRRLSVEEHLASCESCQKQLEDIRRLEELLHDSLPVPPTPSGFATKVMKEARKMTRRTTRSDELPLHSRIRRNSGVSVICSPFRWFASLSTPMRIAACATMLLAIVVGLALDGEGARSDVSSKSRNDLHGLEWFDPTPPGSLCSVYLDMTAHTYQEGTRQ